MRCGQGDNEGKPCLRWPLAFIEGLDHLAKLGAVYRACKRGAVIMADEVSVRQPDIPVADVAREVDVIDSSSGGGVDR